MLYVLAEIQRLPGVAPEAFHAHYEDTHVPLALGCLDFAAYRRHHLIEAVGHAMPACLTLFGYRDAAHFDALREILSGPSGDIIRKDELTFMDKPRNRFYPLHMRKRISEGDINLALRFESAIPSIALPQVTVREYLLPEDASRTPGWLLAHSESALPALLHALAQNPLPVTGLAQLHCAGERL